MDVPATPVAEEWVFTDHDLETLLASSRAGGLIYIWSPHMPYSVKGLREIRAVGERLDLTVTPLLDPQADAALSASVVDEEALPFTALRYLKSTKLFERGATLHFPTLLVFSHGRVSQQMLPGYTSPAVYEAFIKNQLAVMSPQPMADVAHLDAHRMRPAWTEIAEPQP